MFGPNIRNINVSQLPIVIQNLWTRRHLPVAQKQSNFENVDNSTT